MPRRHRPLHRAAEAPETVEDHGRLIPARHGTWLPLHRPLDPGYTG